MPSTYNPLLRLELQATGENATTWGIKTNTNINLLADSIAGATTINVAGSGDYTLSTANGADDESRHSILLLTGLLTGNRNVIVPSSPKNYVVINQTTGAFTLTLKQAAGSGVVITRDGPNLVVCTSTTTQDAIGATPYTKGFLAATSTTPALTALGATSVGAALFVAADTSAARSAIGATTVGSALIIAADTSAARAAIGATTVGSALIVAADASAGRSAISAAASGDITASGLTQATSRLLGRTTAATGAVEEISVGAGLALSAGSLALTSGDLQFNSGYGSVATAYGCRAWVNFNGTGTVAIRASGNVSSITDSGAGTYRVNFTTALVDANYSCVAMASSDNATAMSAGIQGTATAVSTTGVSISTWTDSGTATDRQVVTFAAFR